MPSTRNAAPDSYIVPSTRPSSNAQVVETVIAAEAPVTRGRRSRWWLWTALVAIVLARLASAPLHGLAALRFRFRSVCLAPGGTLYWDAVRLRIRVGAFTRTESVSLDDAAMAVRGTSASAPCHEQPGPEHD